MRTMSSGEFRLSYAHLTEPVVVTVNGHAIGHYAPISTSIDDRYISATRPGEPPSTVSTQAQRDAILRRVNRS